MTDVGRNRALPNYPQMKQLALTIPERGGERKGAGRKRKATRPGCRTRRVRSSIAPLLSSSRCASPQEWNLRSKRCFGAIEQCIADARERFDLRVIEFSVLGNHLHLLVEADSKSALSRGMQGLNVRIARSLNRVMQRRGSVFDDHYHSRLLSSPTQLVNAIAYVLGNHEHHYGSSRGVDPYSSLARDQERVLAQPTTWLLRVGWRRAHRRRPGWSDGWRFAMHRASTVSAQAA